MARGYAAVVSGEIDTSIVSSTRRGAIVNALFALFRVQVLNNWTDDRIENEWSMACQNHDLKVAAVKIEEAQL